MIARVTDFSAFTCVSYAPIVDFTNPATAPVTNAPFIIFPTDKNDFPRAFAFPEVVCRPLLIVPNLGVTPSLRLINKSIVLANISPL